LDDLNEVHHNDEYDRKVKEKIIVWKTRECLPLLNTISVCDRALGWVDAPPFCSEKYRLAEEEEVS